MIITELYVRNFGKLSDRHFYLENGVQIISGDNEFGKTTLHAFIRAMLFGLERGRGRAAAGDDFIRYEPWENPGIYGGMMRFVCGGRRFRLERDFARGVKRASLVCEDDGEELSVEDGDLEVLLGGLTSGIFDSTVSVGQLKAEPGRLLSDALADYAANYYETGGGEYNVSGALNILNEKRRVADRELRAEADAEEAKRRRLQQEMGYLNEDMRRLKAEYAEKSSLSENPDEAADLRCVKRTGTVLMLLGLAAIAAGIGAAAYLFMVQNAAATALAAGTVIFAAGAVLFCLGIRNRKRRRPCGGGRRRPDGTPADIRSRLAGEMTYIRGELSEKKLRYENLQEQYDETGKSECRMRLEEKCRALEMAAERLQKAAQAAGEGMERRLSGRMSGIFASLTGGRYRSVEAGRTKGNFRITVWDGARRIPASVLSRGTVEQLYFSLRMAAADVLLEEPFPVILDDVFAFYDDKRLESVLQWLSREKEQVILLTCHNREERILKNLVRERRVSDEDKFA